MNNESFVVALSSEKLISIYRIEKHSKDKKLNYMGNLNCHREAINSFKIVWLIHNKNIIYILLLNKIWLFQN